VVVQKWDQIVPKGYRTAGINIEQPAKNVPAWDGSCQRRDYCVTPELSSGIFGIGNGVEGELREVNEILL